MQLSRLVHQGRILEVPDSNLDLTGGYTDWGFQFLQAITIQKTADSFQILPY
jgi:hypothetical protein